MPPKARTTKKPVAKKPPAKSKTASSTTVAKKGAAVEVINSVVPYLLFCLSIFIMVCYLFTGAAGIIGAAIRTISYGLFSSGALTVPLFIVLVALYWRRDFERMMVRYKLVFSSVCLLFISVLIHIFTQTSDTLNVSILWKDGLEWSGGGAIGGLIGGLLLKGVGTAGSLIITISILLIFGLFLFGLTPRAAWVWVAYRVHEIRERQNQLSAERPKIRPHFVAVEQIAEGDTAALPVKQREFNPDVSTEDEPSNAENDGSFIDDTVFDEVLRKTKDGQFIENEDDSVITDGDEIIDSVKRFATKGRKKVAGFGESDTIKDDNTGKLGKRKVAGFGESKNAENSADIPRRSDGTIDLGSIFTEDENTGDDKVNVSRQTAASSEAKASVSEATASVSEAAIDMLINQSELVVERRKLSEAGAVKQADETPIERPYVLPPISLLALEIAPDNTDVREELQTTAKKLVDTLTSFKVRTRIVNISRGPTITRYELAPEEGIRVRSISNLVDDIALNLATSGVRIEAPIPGKSAVGIEVPNRIVAIVNVRELIENPRFKTSQSKITVSLGMDVAGEPIYVDISKMPHLLIAGATGMGKSVCINSMIVSLLYKSTPDEVRLILIDPKKVELNIYNGLPHLLVPVVSDPKRAAGSLHWAVTEMERRFTLIESVGVRDIKSYNAAAATRPEIEKLPQIVIIIDELADLMMTAPDDVEESICRLAQKARASGMHLIIGTQRPSVDVITGLIKANIPSRIAFTVASQVDSRTIIDITGAEKLIGRGDMLYAPVGAAKPIRVQGAYVSESEVEAVTSFIKKQGVEAEYDNDVIDKIDAAAAQCGSKKGSASYAVEDDNGDVDPMLKPAIELALESGKISTSLIQRRLSLGYGRAAKIIDRMELLGIVSPPEGQKPRNVLISRQQYMEMVLSRDTFE